MSTLLNEVSQGLSDQGLEVEEDRGGLIVRSEPGGSPTSVWVNEADRVVRAERVIAYPVDDYTDVLGRALDWLNANRGGVSYSFQEAQRAIVGRTCWSSPNRSPSPSQLHLLVALLEQAKGKDGSPLTRVAEGDGDWDEVATGQDIRQQGGGPQAGPAKDPLTLRFTTSRFDPEELLGTGESEPATQHAPSPGGGGWLEPPTRAIQALGDSSSHEAETLNLSPEEARGAEAEGRKSGGYSREALEELVNSDPTDDRPRTSRHALQLAVQQLDDERNEGPPKQDMSAAGRSPIRRLFRVLLLLAIAIPILLILFERIVEPFIPEQDRFWRKWGEEILAPELSPLELRQQMPMGRELLVAELEQPLQGSEARIEGSLRALGEKKQEVLEDLLIVSELSDLRKRAYVHWRAVSDEDPLAPLKLLKRITIAERKRPTIQRYLTEAIQRDPPPDEVLIESLGWAKKGQCWPFFVKLLGRPGEGAEARAKALGGELANDTQDCLVLRALILTGHGSPSAIQTLIEKRGAAWCSGAEGRPLLTSLVTKHPDSVDGLLETKDRALSLLGVRLLQDAKTENTIKKLVKVAYSKSGELWVRERAAEALRGRDLATIQLATWPLVYVVNQRETPASLRFEVEQTLQSYGELGVEALEPYTTRDRASTRRYAVVGLGVMQSEAAAERLVGRLGEEQDARLRRLVLETLDRLLLEKGTLKRLLERKVIVFLKVSREDSDPNVRRVAEKLYRTLTAR